jgi:uncharacterized protein (DUF1330 family)
MPKAYWIGRVDVFDPEAYKAYQAANAAAFKKYGARFLVRAGAFENPEGDSRSRNVVIEFPSFQAAKDCWHSPEYQAAIALRKDVSVIDLILIEGYEGAQPGD